MTQIELQEHLEDPVHVDLPSDVQERVKKESDCGIENTNLEQKLEESRKEINYLARMLQGSRKETAEMKEQYHNLKENFHKALDRESNWKKELDAFKNRSSIFGTLRSSLLRKASSKSSKPKQSHRTSSSGNY